MRCENSLCPKFSVVLWLALGVLASSATGQEAGRVAFSKSHSQIVSDSTAISNPDSASNDSANSFRDISEGISIANRVPMQLARRRMELTNAQLSNTLITADELSQQKPHSAPLSILPPPLPPAEVPVPRTPAPAARSDAVSPSNVPSAADELMSSDRTESSNSAAKSVDDRFLSELTRPMLGINLADAARSETLNGTQLDGPTDVATGFQFNADAVYDAHNGYGLRYPRRNLTPIWYNPLYFEDPNLERCGQGHGIFTEYVSMARFFGRIPVGPYMFASNPPNSCVRSLGDCPTCSSFGIDAYLPPLDPHASAFQAACTVGLIFLIP